MAIVERDIQPAPRANSNIIERDVQDNVFQGNVGQQMILGGLRGLANVIPGTPYAVNFYTALAQGKSKAQALDYADKETKAMESIKLPSRIARFTEVGANLAPTFATMQPFLKGATLIPKLPGLLKIGAGMAGYGGASAILQGKNPLPAMAEYGAVGTALGPFSRLGTTAGYGVGKVATSALGEVGEKYAPQIMNVAKRAGSAGANYLLGKTLNPQDEESALLYGVIGGVHPQEKFNLPKSFTKENFAQKLNQQVIGARKGQFRHGNPPLTLAKEGITFANLDEGIVKTEAAIQNINNDIQAKLAESSQSGLVFHNYETALKPLYELRRSYKTAPDVNNEKIKTINNILMNLKGYSKTPVTRRLRMISANPLSNATPVDAYKAKQTVHELAGESYNSPTGGTRIAGALREVNRNLVDMISRKVGNIKGIDGKYIRERLKVEGDLIEAKGAMQNKIQLEQTKGEADLFRKIRFWGGVGGGAFAGGTVGGPIGAAVGSISAAQLEKALLSPSFRTKVAAWLAKEKPAKRINILKRFPQLGNLFNRP